MVYRVASTCIDILYRGMSVPIFYYISILSPSPSVHLPNIVLTLLTNVSTILFHRFQQIKSRLMTWYMYTQWYKWSCLCQNASSTHYLLAFSAWAWSGRHLFGYFLACIYYLEISSCIHVRTFIHFNFHTCQYDILRRRHWASLRLYFLTWLCSNYVAYEVPLGFHFGRKDVQISCVCLIVPLEIIYSTVSGFYNG